jgi:hypothetical protein
LRGGLIKDKIIKGKVLIDVCGLIEGRVLIEGA